MKPFLRLTLVLLLLPVASIAVAASEFKAGTARDRITPPLPFWLTGYASRTNPAATVNTELWAKALALEDRQGHRLVIVTSDLIGLPREVSEAVADYALQKHRLPRSAILLNSSHTHSGPVVWPNLRIMFGFDAAETRHAEAYARSLILSLITIVDAALTDLGPANLEVGHGTAGFAINRRQPTPQGVRIGQNPTGPVDHDVPVLKVTDRNAKLRAVLFGYACHNTTLGGDFYQVDGDYAGAAQRLLESSHPGSTALFLMLCGGDQNPHPRGTLAQVDQHGQELASAVEQVLTRPMAPVRSPIRTAWQEIDLEFASHDRAVFEKETSDGSVFRRRRAQLMLEAYDANRPVRRIAYPVQAARLGNDLTFLALGGEVVVDYALRAKHEYPAENLVVAGYCNDVPCYIASRRVLEEGGYEAVDSMIYYGQPGPLAEGVEETIFTAIRESLARVGANPAR